MLFKVFMDTNIYEGANFSFYNPSFRSMREYAQKNELSIVINPVIEGEVRAHIEKKMREKIRELNKLTKDGAFAFYRNL